MGEQQQPKTKPPVQVEQRSVQFVYMFIIPCVTERANLRGIIWQMRAMPVSTPYCSVSQLQLVNYV